LFDGADNILNGRTLANKYLFNIDIIL